MDKFYEQFLATSKNSIYKLLNLLVYISGIIGGVLFVLPIIPFNLVTSVFFIIMTFVLLKSRDKQYKEFEYIFTNGNLQIDVIYNQKKRKTLIDFDVKDFEAFGSEKEVKIPKGTEVLNLIPWDYKGDKYIFIFNDNGRKAVYISPDEEMLKLIKIYNRDNRGTR